jgi:hypothetical protein
MGRFLDPENLERYRKLTSDKMNAVERNRVLKVLAQEWDVFLRECRMGGARQVRSTSGDGSSGGSEVS